MKLVGKTSRDRKYSTAPTRSHVDNRNITQTGSTAVNQNRNIQQNPNINRNTAASPDNSTATRNNGAAARSNGAASRNSNTTAAQGKGINTKNNQAEPIKKKKSSIKTAVIILLILVIGATALLISLAYYVESLDTIFPNVWAEGIKVSGQTVEEATQTFIDEGYERNAEGISASMTFPDGSGFTVTGNDVGLALDAAQAARTVFTFGRTESFFNNMFTYIRSLFNRTDLFDLSTATMDDSPIRLLAAEYTAKFNETLFESSIEHNENHIVVIRGTGLFPAVEDEVFDLTVHTLLRAVSEHEHKSVTYTPEVNHQESLNSQINELQMLFDYIHVDAVSSQLIFNDDEITVTESFTGKTFDFDSAVERLSNASIGMPVEIPIYILYPYYTQEDLEGMLFRDVLAESTTTLANNSNRTSNVTLAARKIDGTILNPGDLFSFNEIVGSRTIANGFLEAPVILGGRLQPGIGGGICQVSSTIYDALLRTGIFPTEIEMVERRPHGLTITYLAPGHDATVAYGNIDFKFRNKMDFPMKIETSVSGRQMNVRIIGTNYDGTRIEVESSEPVITPFSIQDVETDELIIGETELWTSGQNGVRVEIFQLLYSADGELISRTSVGRSTYNVQNRITRHGTAEAPPTPEPTPSPTPDPTPPPTPDPTPPPTPDPTPPPTPDPTPPPGGDD